ncbi:hypothetical protein CEXT_72161 [Caerostris extrusa]|uniref:Uncharacterized protein n=1 Tax=Caerostris extrusa TaxID=172846 RepID=A0AAV4VAU6_CAEEX|nr:hypothetical protein CEXT_72161 [Caerostris extrusa]
MSTSNLTYEQELIHRFGMDESEANETMKKAGRIYRELMDITYYEKLKVENKSHVQELLAEFMEIIHVQEKSIYTLLGANGELEKLVQKKPTFSEIVKTNLNKQKEFKDKNQSRKIRDQAYRRG